MFYIPVVSFGGMVYYLQNQFSDLRSMEVVDHEDRPIGKVGDFVLTNDFEIEGFVLSTGLLQTIKEKIQNQDPTSPFIGIDEVIEIRDEKLICEKVKTDFENLVSKHQHSHIFFSKMKNAKVFDKNMLYVGRVIDAICHIDRRISFILGGSYFEEVAEDLGLIKDLDIFLPTSIIDDWDHDTIKLTIPSSDIPRKSTRLDIKRGIDFDRNPNDKRHVFYRLEANIADLIENRKRLLKKINRSAYTDSVTIRNLDREKDIHLFKELHDKIFLTSPDPVRPITNKEVMQFDPNSTFIAEVSKIPAGFMYLPIENGTDGKSHFGAVAGIGVVSFHRGKKIGYTLLNHALDYFSQNNVSKVVCEVYEKNEPSRKMFESLGFKINGYMILEDEQ